MAIIACAAVVAGVTGCAPRAKGPPRVAGRVVDEHGKPLFGVSVIQYVTGWSRRVTTTGPDGVFVMPPLPLTGSNQFVIGDHPMDPLTEAPLVVHAARDARMVVTLAGVEQLRFGPDPETTCAVSIQVFAADGTVVGRVVDVPLDGGETRIEDIRLPSPD